MKSIKPGRGPSGMSFIGSIVAIVFGVFWTIMAANITAHSPFGIVGAIFPLFGILFILVGVVQAVYHYRNATGKDRYSIFDITDSSEEGDPLNKWVKNEIKDVTEKEQEITSAKFNYCPFCGAKVDSEYLYCPKCGKTIK